MTNDKQAESAARKIAERCDELTESVNAITEDELLEICFDADRCVAEFAPLISAEYEPVMEVLRDVSKMPVEAALEAGAPLSIKMGMLSITLHLKRRAQKILENQ